MRESEFLERAPSGDQLFYVPYLLRRNKNFYANIFLGKPNCTCATDSCAIGGGAGGGGNQQNWQGSAPPSPKIVFLFSGLFLKAREAPLKKRKRSETARPQFWFWIKIRVNPIYLVIFLGSPARSPSLIA